jgi:hypothetical protein
MAFEVAPSHHNIPEKNKISGKIKKKSEKKPIFF